MRCHHVRASISPRVPRNLSFIREDEESPGLMFSADGETFQRNAVRLRQLDFCSESRA